MTTSSRTVHLCGEAVETPGHICAFFSDRDEEYDVLIPYLRQGIDEGDVVVNVLDGHRMADHQRRLEQAGLPVDEIELGRSEDTYLRGDVFDMERMETFVRDRLVAASAEGRCVRTAGWMDWVHSNALDTRRAMEYEARMNMLVPAFDCTFMCVYDLSRLQGDLIADILATHPYVIMNGRIRKNSFYVPPDVYLRELLS